MKRSLWRTLALLAMLGTAGAEPSPTPQEEWQAILKKFVPRLATHGGSAAERFSFTVIIPFVHLSLECRRDPDGDTVLMRDLQTGNVVAYTGNGIQVYLRPDWPGRFRVIRPAHGFCAISVGEASVGLEFGLELSGNNGLLLDLSGWSRGLLESVPEGLITNHVEPDGTRIFTHYLRAMAKRMVVAPATSPFPLRECTLYLPNFTPNLHVRDIEIDPVNQASWKSLSLKKMRDAELWYDVRMVTPDEDSRRGAFQEWQLFISNPEHRRSPQAIRSSQALEKLITGTAEPSPVGGSDYSFAPWPDEALEAAHKSARQAQPRLKVDPDDTQVVQGRRRGNVLEVPVSINENDAIWMGVDTGLSTDFLIDQRFAEQWEFTRMSEPIEKQTDTHLTKHTQARLAVALQSRDVSGDFEILRYRAETISIGGVPVEPVQGISFAERERNNEGLLGRPFLENTPFTLDYQAATITFHDPDDFSPPPLARKFDISLVDDYWTIEGALFASQEEGDTIPVRLVLDTGYSGLLALGQNFVTAHQNLFEGPLVTPARANTIVSHVYLNATRIPGAEIFDEHFQNVLVHQLGMDFSPDVDGLIGSDWLRRFRVTVDRENLCLYLERITPEDLTRSAVEGNLGKPWPHSDASPLEEAAGIGDAVMLQSLLDSGVSETSPALIAAMIRGHQPCIDLLLNAGAGSKEFKAKALVAAAELGTIDLVKQLLAAGANPRASEGGEAPSAFIRAVLRGDLEIIKVLLEAGANVSQRYQDQSALALAARQGHVDVVEFLLEQGLDPLEIQAEGAMAAHFAAGEGHVDVLRCLAKHGLSLTAMQADGLTPAGMAAFTGLDETVRWIIEQTEGIAQAGGPRIPLLFAAAKGGHLDLVNWLLDEGADPNEMSPEPIVGTPLLGALRESHSEIAGRLLEAGADPNTRVVLPPNIGGEQYALLLAGHHGLTEIVRRLFELGAEVTENEAQILAQATAMAGHWETLLVIMEHLETLEPSSIRAIHTLLLDDPQSDPFLPQLAPHLPLSDVRHFIFNAIIMEHHVFFKTYLDAGFDPDLTFFHDELGPVPLIWWAAIKGAEVPLALLIDRGAKLDVAGGRDEDSPLAQAALEGDPALVQLLLDAGVAVDFEDIDKMTPLMKAAQKGKFDNARLLLEAGADPMKKDFFGRSVEEHIEDEEILKSWLELRKAWENDELTE